MIHFSPTVMLVSGLYAHVVRFLGLIAKNMVYVNICNVIKYCIADTLLNVILLFKTSNIKLLIIYKGDSHY